jgi:hypothetical protein
VLGCAGVIDVLCCVLVCVIDVCWMLVDDSVMAR